MSARFRPGDRVRVHLRYPPGHIRTPFYCRGHVGEIERVCGTFANPEQLAFGLDGKPGSTLYRVRFRQADMWPDYHGPADDHLEIEIYDHWLDPVDPPRYRSDDRASEGARHAP